MYEQFFMYWILWIILIIVFFFMEHGGKRNILSIWLLMVISLTNFYIPVATFQLSMSLAVILLGTCIYIVEYSFSLLQLIRAFIIMITYCSILIWEMLAPIWFVFSSYFLIPVIIVAVALLLNKKMKEVYAFLLLGITLGQVLFDLLLINYYINDLIGMTYYFIHIGLCTLLLISIHFTLYVYNSASYFLQKKIM